MSGYWASVSMGYLFLRMGEFSQAQTILVKCQQQFKAVDQSSGVTYATEGLASLAVAKGRLKKLPSCSAGRMPLGRR